MSGGWIKLEKDLLTDPRLIRMADELNKLPRDAQASHLETLVLGGMTKLWMLADTHVGNGDILPLGVDQINKLIGVQGFCQLIPQNWLQIIDANNVKLPKYHAHNGTEAKRLAQTQKRNVKYRKRRDATPSPPRDARASLDQDQDHIKNNPLPLCDNLDANAWAEWTQYRKSIGKSLKAASIPLAQIKLASFGKSQLAVVRQSIALGYAGLFELKTNGHAAPVTTAAPPLSAEWLELRAAARGEDFRNPYNGETAAQFADALARYRNRSGPKIDTAAITAKLRVSP